MYRIYNRNEIEEVRKTLRKRMPKPEALVWQNIRGKQLGEYKFRRQYSVGSYILDFYCPQAKLGIEIDGDSHFSDNAQKYDQERTEFISEFNITIIRFTNREVMDNLCGVLESINKYLSSLSTSTPSNSPLVRGRDDSAQTT